jgi:hypothetical protein
MHKTVMVVIRADEAANAVEALDLIDEKMAKYDQNLSVPERVEWVTEQEAINATAYYKERPTTIDDYGPGPLADVPEGNLEAFQAWQARCVGAFHGNGPETGVYDEAEGRFGCRTTYNTDGRWDWYQLGGRWRGELLLKKGVAVGALPEPAWRTALSPGRTEATAGLPVAKEHHQAIVGLSGSGGNDPSTDMTSRADLARKRDINFAQMRVLAAQAADLAYDQYEQATAGIEPGPSMRELTAKHLRLAGIDENYDPYREDVMSADKLERYQEARMQAGAEYRAQPWVRALQNANLQLWFGDSHSYWTVSREEFVARAERAVLVTADVLIDGVWRDGETSADTQWVAEQARIVDNLDDDDWIAIVDYHS